MKCEKDQMLMRPEPWARVISPNVYRLFDKYVCLKCKLLKIVKLGTIDKNTEGTRRAMRELTEKKDKKTKVFKEKTIAYPYKDDNEDGEINIESLF